MLRARPKVTEIPPSFNFYAEKSERSQYATSITPAATAISNSYTTPASSKSKMTPSSSGGTPSSVPVVSDARVTAHGREGNRLRMRPPGIKRVGVLKVERIEEPFRSGIAFVKEVK